MPTRYHDLAAAVEDGVIRLRLAAAGARGAIGWQLYDPEEALFLAEGEWTPAAERMDMNVALPEQDGAYRVYVSAVDETAGWEYARGGALVVLDAERRGGQIRITPPRVTTLGALRREAWWRALPELLRGPFAVLARNRGLIASLVKRDILARYRGSLGGVLWTLLNPLLLMATYFFVFGVVLQARFGADPSREGFALYFLAGMLPWLPFAEAVGRSANVILEHRTFVKKLRFPVETLPLNLTFAGLITEAFALVVFLAVLLALRGVPPAILYLPLILVPQLLLTAGLCWFFAATGVFVRDLAQILGFALTLWFFVTPICYDAAALPAAVRGPLAWNPVWVLVRSYRRVLLEGQAPEWAALAAVTGVGLVTAWLGYAWFARLRRAFADVL